MFRKPQETTITPDEISDQVLDQAQARIQKEILTNSETSLKLNQGSERWIMIENKFKSLKSRGYELTDQEWFLGAKKDHCRFMFTKPAHLCEWGDYEPKSRLQYYDCLIVHIKGQYENAMMWDSPEEHRLNRRFDDPDKELLEKEKNYYAWIKNARDREAAEAASREYRKQNEIIETRCKQGFKLIYRKHGIEIFCKSFKDHYNERKFFVVKEIKNSDGRLALKINDIGFNDFTGLPEKDIIRHVEGRYDLLPQDYNPPRTPEDEAKLAQLIWDTVNKNFPDGSGDRTGNRSGTKAVKSLDGSYYLDIEIKEFNYSQADNKISFIASTGSVDRVNDIIPENQWKNISQVNKKGVPLLLYHDKTKPIGRVYYVTPNEKGLFCKATIDTSTQDGIQALRMIKNGTLREFSVGFIPGSARKNDQGGYTYSGCELTEISVVTVPASRDTDLLTVNIGGATIQI